MDLAKKGYVGMEAVKDGSVPGLGGQYKTDGKYLTFWTDEQLYGIPIACVQQIVKFQEVTKIPETPHYVKGVINLRGLIIPIVDMRIRLGKEDSEYTERTCIIVTSMRDLAIGFIVEGVDEVTDIGDDDISEPPAVSQSGNNGFLAGIGKKNKRVTLLLDLNKLISDEDVANITAGI